MESLNTRVEMLQMESAITVVRHGVNTQDSVERLGIKIEMLQMESGINRHGVDTQDSVERKSSLIISLVPRIRQLICVGAIEDNTNGGLLASEGLLIIRCHS